MAVPPAETCDTPHGRVMATTHERACQVASLLVRFEPEVVRLLPDAKEVDPEVWVQEDLRLFRTQTLDGLTGFSVTSPALAHPRIHLLDGDRFLRGTLCHELTHVMLGDSWKTLPSVLEEGVADVVAAKLNPDLLPRIRARRLVDASRFFGGLQGRLVCRRESARSDGQVLQVDLLAAAHFAPERGGGEGDARKLLAISQDQNLFRLRTRGAVPDYHGLGYLVAARIIDRFGLEGLHQLCEQAGKEGRKVVPVDRLLNAAGMKDMATWERTAVEMLGEEELRELSRAVAPVLVQGLIDSFADEFPGYTGEDFLTKALPRLRLDGGPTISLGDIREIQAGILESWPRADNFRRVHRWEAGVFRSEHATD